MENIKRINGFINLDDYFKNKYDLSKISIDVLDNNKLIKPAYGSSQLLFWFDYFYNNVLFKSGNVDSAYIELINEEFIKNIGLDSAHYDLAIFNDYIGNISYDFKIKDYVYKDLYYILSMYYNYIILNNKQTYNLSSFCDIDEASSKLNNLNDIRFALEYYYRKNKNREDIVQNLMDNIIKLFIYDLFMNQSDRHCSNIMICENINDNKDVTLAPIYDFSDSLYRRKKYNQSIVPSINNYNKNSNSNKDILISFLNIEHFRYQDILFYYLNTLTPDKLLKTINRIEIRCNTKIPNNITKKIYNNYANNYNEISNITNKLQNNNSLIKDKVYSYGKKNSI